MNGDKGKGELDGPTANQLTPPSSSSGRTRRKWTVIASIAVALILIAATASYIQTRRLSIEAALSTGPGIQVSVDPTVGSEISQGVLASNLPNVTIQVFSFVPNSAGYSMVNLTTANISANPYAEELFQGIPNATGTVAGNLSYGFYALDQAWLTHMSALTQSVSLQLYATLAVTQKGETYQYTYFNNLPYNPRAPPTEFSTAVAFPSHPTFAGPALSLATSSGGVVSSTKPPPSCDDGYYWDPKNETYISNGDVPLAIANATSAPSGAGISYGISYADTALELSFTSATEWSNYTAYSGLQMSEAPSWSGDDTSFQGAEESGDSFSGGTPTMIGLGGAELTIWNYQEAYVSGTYPNCHQAWLDKTSTGVELDGFENGASYDFITPSLPAYFGSLLSDMVDWSELSSQQLTYGGAGVQFYSVIETAEGYTSAQDAESSAEAGFSALDFALGAALLVCDVLDDIPGFSAADSAPEALVILGDVAGLADDLMTLFSTISFSTTSHTSIEQFGVNVANGGAHDNLQAAFYSATTAEELSIGGTNYSPDMPLIYVDAT